MNIPVFHDDQHGTAIIAAAALLNALKLVNKDIADIKIVCSGAGAAAISCLELIIALGAKRSNIYVLDSRGVITTRRDNLDASKQLFAQDTNATTLSEVIDDADFFLGSVRSRYSDPRYG